MPTGGRSMPSHQCFRYTSALVIYINCFLTLCSVSGVFLGQIPAVVKFLRDRRTGNNQELSCHLDTNRDPLAATHASIRPCNITRLPPGSRAETIARSFALHWNLGNLREAVRELRTLYASRVNLTYPRTSTLLNLTRLPVELREGSTESDHSPFHRIAEDLRRFYVSINQAEHHEIDIRQRRLNTLEQKLCYVRGHLRNVLCTLHAALEETAQEDIQTLTRIVQQLAEMRRVHHPGALDVWIYLLFRDLDNYLQRMHDFVSSIDGVS